nr:immunoglobulin light chain junction region [Macaca mulatta]
CLQGYSPSYSF